MTHTYMELSQLCFYLNLKAYKFKDELKNEKQEAFSCYIKFYYFQHFLTFSYIFIL